MHCNFRIAQHVELNGAFGALDVHGVYRLDRCEADDATGALRLAFRAAYVLRKGRPQTFRIDFSGLDLLEMHAVPAELPTLEIEEAGFMAPDDRDYRWLLHDGEPGPGKHLVLKGAGGEVIRVSAERAEVTVTDLPSRAPRGVTRALAWTWAAATLLTLGAAFGAWNERTQALTRVDRTIGDPDTPSSVTPAKAGVQVKPTDRRG
ncbi:hypothetical protein [Caulobacter sp. 17J80-11]|uniref:hypothetical protein n=1 Tax=Caulobacter sp. 17J80-11 TaxID=2763502 RepID=UPI001653DF32|nr:hypothetical protein [Caulobacter sp. 17J80-11]MBC6981357.1 hypothetical protein [Caulobacter sp. 17J80-11]